METINFTFEDWLNKIENLNKENILEFNYDRYLAKKYFESLKNINYEALLVWFVSLIQIFKTLTR